MTFEEEKRYNNPIHSLRWPLENFKKSKFISKEGMYEWEDIEFGNIQLVREAAQHFQDFNTYCPYDPIKEVLLTTQWWERELYRRKEGITVNIKVPKGGANSDKDLLPLWIPGVMYGHLNYGPIIRTSLPEDDVTLDVIASLHGEAKVKAEKEFEVNKLFKGLQNKKKVELKPDFPDFWDGHFHVYISMYIADKLGMNYGIAKARRKGFSFVGGWKAFDVFNLVPNSTVLMVTYDNKYLTEPGGLFTMAKAYADHINAHTPWEQSRLVNKVNAIRSGYKYKGEDEEHGFKSQILCLSAQDNPDCTRGKAANLILWEELGSFPNFEETQKGSSSTTEAGAYAVGQQIFWGTVGSKEEDYAGLTAVMYNPTKYDCLPHKNVWDEQPDDTATSCWFGQYQNMLGAIDKNGNSNKEEAKQLFAIQKEKHKQNATISEHLAWLSERAITPKDALSSRTDNLFSPLKDKITKHLKAVENKLKKEYEPRCGQYRKNKDGIKFVSNEELKALGEIVYPPINKLPGFMPKGSSMHGCIQEWDVPFLNTHGEIPDKLYGAWHDPYATDKTRKDIKQTDSMGVCFIYEFANNITPSQGQRIVASWIGRPDSLDAYNEQLFYMLDRWNAKLLFENDRGEVVPYARRINKTHKLQLEPEMRSNKPLSGKTGRTYGLSIQKNYERKSAGALLARDFLGSKVSVDTLTGEDIYVLNRICDTRLLHEILKWSMSGNFDAVSTLIIGMFDIAERLDAVLEDTNVRSRDNFFDRDFF
jgi:hypothetical protein